METEETVEKLIFTNLVWDLKAEAIMVQVDQEIVPLTEEDKEQFNVDIGVQPLIMEYPSFDGDEVVYDQYEYDEPDLTYDDVFETMREHFSDPGQYSKLGEFVWFDSLGVIPSGFRLNVRNTELYYPGEEIVGAEAKVKPDFYAWQTDHFNNISNVVEKWHVYLDCSPTGTGKTYVNCALADKFALKLIVVAPKILVLKWRQVAELFHLDILAILSYDDLISVRGYQPKTEYLTRFDGEEKKDTTYEVTESFKSVVKDGVLLIFDEIQKLKNASLKTKASFTLVKTLIDINNTEGSSSRVGLLSATPADKVIHTQSLIKMMGLTSVERLTYFNPKTKLWELDGLTEVYNWGIRIDPMKTRIIFNRQHTKNNMALIMFDFVTQVALPYLGSAMPALPLGNSYNGFFKISSKKDVATLSKGISELKMATKNINELEIDEEAIKKKTGSIGAVVNALERCESAKINDVIRLAKEDLQSDPNLKVILYFNYYKNKSIDTALRELDEYNPLEYSGRIGDIKKRQQNIDLFQQDNNDYRVLIGTVKAGSSGIDLDDKFGTHPRLMYIMPSYEILELYQAVGRVTRSDSKSKGTVFFVYASGEGQVEQKLLDAIARKSIIAKQFILTATIPPFPNDYEVYNEE